MAAKVVIACEPPEIEAAAVIQVSFDLWKKNDEVVAGCVLRVAVPHNEVPAGETVHLALATVQGHVKFAVLVVANAVVGVVHVPILVEAIVLEHILIHIEFLFKLPQHPLFFPSVRV